MPSRLSESPDPAAPHNLDKAMNEPVCAQTAPFAITLEAGKKYAWCACGRSGTQPLCDGSHKETGMKPVVFTAEQTETVYLCGCKRTAQRPFCDGTHSTLTR